MASNVLAAVKSIDIGSSPDSIRDDSQVSKIKTPDQLASYYNVDPQRVVKIRNSNLSEIKSWVKNWNQKQEIVVSVGHDTSISKSISSASDRESTKPILLITGDPGAGKSWLAYRLVSELMENDHYSISVINGTNIRKQLFVKSNNFMEKDDNKKELANRSVFILDDIGTSVGVVSSSITLEDIYEIIKSILPGGLEQVFTAPIILSIREENWNYIVNGLESKAELDEYKLKEMVKKVVLLNLEYRESEKIVESFYKVVDEKKPPYPNIVIKKEVKDKIIEKSRGIPFIIKLFFHQMNSMIDHNQRYAVKLEEAEYIISNAKYYALKQFFNYYPISNNDKEQVTNVLSFLYFIAKNGSISIGLLDYLREKLEESVPNYFKEYLYSLRYEKSFPLFNIDNYGIILPFHTSIIEAIINLVENPEELEAEVPFEYENIKEKIREIIDIDIGIDIKEKAENNFLKRYMNFVTDSLDHYLEKRLNREIERRRKISAKSTYNFLSIYIEFLNRRKELDSGWPKKDLDFGSEIENKYRNILKELLEKTTIDYGNLEINIHEQLFWIFTRRYWFFYKYKFLRQYYLKFLSSNNNNVKVKTWKQVPDLLSRKILTAEEIMAFKEHFLDLLNNNDEKIREQAWNGWHISELIRENIVTVEEMRSIKNKFFEILQSNQEEVRIAAWQSLSYYYSNLIRNKIITRDDHITFLHLLQIANESARAEAWNSLTFLIQEHIIKTEEIFQFKIISLIYCKVR
ncbi:MAG TPA: adenylyl-sulfate kinase [Nitrososphaeraceae archaeon]|nr:adenylyl-sulfate kinase [Nitrososphaeraceae archaeon]